MNFARYPVVAGVIAPCASLRAVPRYERTFRRIATTGPLVADLPFGVSQSQKEGEGERRRRRKKALRKSRKKVEKLQSVEVRGKTITISQLVTNVACDESSSAAITRQSTRTCQAKNKRKRQSEMVMGELCCSRRRAVRGLRFARRLRFFFAS